MTKKNSVADFTSKPNPEKVLLTKKRHDKLVIKQFFVTDPIPVSVVGSALRYISEDKYFYEPVRFFQWTSCCLLRKSFLGPAAQDIVICKKNTIKMKTD